jgi:pyruvyltransferase
MAGLPGVRVFWMRRRPNFGDAMAPLLVETLARAPASWAKPWLSDAVVIGSVIDRLPRRYGGVVIGAGLLERQSAMNIRGARLLGLRGELTRTAAGAGPGVVLGDSGLLAADLLGERPPATHRLGVVPHFKDLRLAQRYPDALVIDVSRPPLDVLRAIASCEHIISSSLHGLVTADALGIPRRWEPSPMLRGGGFKFADYASAFGQPIEPYRWQTAPTARIERIATELRDVFATLPSEVRRARDHRLPGVARVVERMPGGALQRLRVVR